MLKKMFQNDLFFSITTWVGVLATIPYVIVVSLLYSEPFILYENCLRFISAVCIAVEYISYKKHSKNVMKGMASVVLITIADIALTSWFINESYRTVSMILVIMCIMLFINHFVINSDHNSRPLNIYINQALALLISIAGIFSFVSLLPTCVNTADAVVTVLAAFAQPFCMLSIICVESRLDAYRINREAAGWTEEKGYPQGYVHEYQKDKQE